LGPSQLGVLTSDQKGIFLFFAIYLFPPLQSGHGPIVAGSILVLRQYGQKNPFILFDLFHMVLRFFGIRFNATKVTLFPLDVLKDTVTFLKAGLAVCRFTTVFLLIAGSSVKSALYFFRDSFDG